MLCLRGARVQPQQASEHVLEFLSPSCSSSNTNHPWPFIGCGKPCRTWQIFLVRCARFKVFLLLTRRVSSVSVSALIDVRSSDALRRRRRRWSGTTGDLTPSGIGWAARQRGQSDLSNKSSGKLSAFFSTSSFSSCFALFAANQKREVRKSRKAVERYEVLCNNSFFCS